MQEYILSYDVCALLFLTVFSAYYFTRKKFPSVQNRIFSMLINIVIVCSLLDMISVTLLNYRNYIPLWINYLINIIYLTLLHFCIVYFCMYVIVQTRVDELFVRSRLTHIIFVSPYIAAALLILSTPITKLIFYFDESLNYLNGEGMTFLFIIAGGYISFSIIRLLVYRKNVQIKKRISMYVFIIFLSAAIIIQGLFPRYLLYSFASALGVLAIYLSQQNPNDMIDARTELFNRRALLIKLNELISDKSLFGVIAFCVEDFIYIYDRYSYSTGDSILAQIAEYTHKSFGDNRVYYIDNYTFVILVMDEENECQICVDKIKVRFGEKWGNRESEIALDIVMTILKYPDDSEKSYQLLDMIDYGIESAKERGSGSIIYGYELLDIKEQRINKLVERQKYLEEHSKIVENEMRAAVKSDKSKTVFLAQMSHEIRTPMTAILGMTELIMRDTVDEKILNYASSIQNSGQSLLAIINDILDFSKIEAGRMEIIPDEYYISSTIYDIINTVELRMSEKHLEFGVHFDPSIPAVLFGDEMRLKQVIINLLTNAAKYTEKGSVKLNIEWERQGATAWLNISVSDTGIGIREENISKLFIGFERFDTIQNKAVEGTGLGLAICKQILDAMDGEIHVNSKYGFGSTFTIKVPQIISNDTYSIKINNEDERRLLIHCENSNQLKAYKETINDFSIYAEYTDSSDLFDKLANDMSFTHLFITYNEFIKRKRNNDKLINDKRLIISLECRQFGAELRNIRSMNMPICSINLSSVLNCEDILKNRRSDNVFKNYIAPEASILVVDDNSINLKIFCGLLEHHKMGIDVAESGDGSLVMTAEKKYDIIFLDHMMPKKDGIETLYDMRKNSNDKNSNTPVIAFTANAVSGMKEKFKDEGFADFLSKPIDIVKLEEIILKYLPKEFVIEVEEKEKNEEKSFVVEGMDMNEALLNCGGSYSKLMAVLKVVAKDGRNKICELEEFYSDNDYKNYCTAVHGLKSVAAGIGKSALSEKARELEEMLKRGETSISIDKHKNMINMYKELLDKLDILIEKEQEKTDRAETQINTINIKERMICILALLHDYEEELAEKMTNELNSYGIDDETAMNINLIKEKLSVYDYDNAAKIIEKITCTK